MDNYKNRPETGSFVIAERSFRIIVSEEICIQEIIITFFDNNKTLYFKLPIVKKQVFQVFLVVEIGNRTYPYNYSTIKSMNFIKFSWIY